MKQKRTYLTLLLVVALLVLGIAYAAFTPDVLTINGSAAAAVATGKVDVEFKSVTGTTATIDNSDKDKATFTLEGFTTANEAKTVTFTVENKTANGVPVILSAPTIEWDNEEWYNVTATWNDTELAAYDAEGVTDEATLTVTVTLKKTVSTDANISDAVDDTITITLNAEAAAN